MRGVSGLVKAARPLMLGNSVGWAFMMLVGRPLILPQPFFLAKLPALVALKPPAEYPLMILWLVLCVLVVPFVVVLCTPLEELVALDLVVNVRPMTSRPSSYADLRFFKRGP